MTLEEVRDIVGETPHMSFAQAMCLAQFIREHRVRQILELGFAHGVSTCYMASALMQMEGGGGSIVTIDRPIARTRTPNIDQLLERCRCGHLVTKYFEPTSYTWRLMRFLQETPRPQFDLCYVDGAHSWSVDGFAFFLVNLLLRKGGWLIFDDVDWSYANSPSLQAEDWVRDMPRDERTIPQVRLVYELLVKTHPEYDNFAMKDGWAYAQKVGQPQENMVRKEVVYHDVLSLRSVVGRVKDMVRARKRSMARLP